MRIAPQSSAPRPLSRRVGWCLKYNDCHCRRGGLGLITHKRERSTLLLTMDALVDKIRSELSALVGLPITDCWRVANMQVFGFGPKSFIRSSKGGEVETSQINLHVQCRWRFVDAHRVLFGSDDLSYPAEENMDVKAFDWASSESLLDAKQKQWFIGHPSMKMTSALGDPYGGFAICFEGGFSLQSFPCGSQRGEPSEHWRMFGHRADGSHFVVFGDGD